MAPHSSTLAWKIPWTEEPGRLQSMGSQRVGHDWVTSLSLFTFMHWRMKWRPTPVFLPGESQGREPGGLPPMGSHRVGHDRRDLAAAAAAITEESQNFGGSKRRNVISVFISSPKVGRYPRTDGWFWFIKKSNPKASASLLCHRLGYHHLHGRSWLSMGLKRVQHKQGRTCKSPYTCTSQHMWRILNIDEIQ